jgi:S-adenosylmethionine hydrolase
MAIEVDGRWFVGPGNGLFEIVTRRSRKAQAWEITWRPRSLSLTFHGRDLYAPEAARLASGLGPRGVPVALVPDRSWPDELYRVIYVDHYGNCMTGVRARAFPEGAALLVRGRRLPRARTFGEVASGQAFFYENSNGLIEIAVREGRASEVLGIGIGEPIAAEQALLHP